MIRLLAGLLLFFRVAIVGAGELQAVPALESRVTDLTATLSAGQRGSIERQLAAFEQEKGVQISVLLLPTTQPETIEQYSLRVAEQWKPGRSGIDDGVLLLVAKQDRNMRIEVGYGLEGVLNDATAKRIIAETIVPKFREGQFYEGIDAGIGRIIAVVRGESLPPPERRGAGKGMSSPDLEEFLFAGLVLVTFIAGILRTIFGRFLGAAIVGGLAAFIVMLLFSSLLLAGLAGALSFVFALFSGNSGARWGGGFPDGRWGRSSGRNSRGLGGFSGGGGGFGGGGASGGW